MLFFDLWILECEYCLGYMVGLAAEPGPDAFSEGVLADSILCHAVLCTLYVVVWG